MPSPDLSALVDLTLYDKTMQEVYDAAIDDLVTKLPDWIPREGNTEVLLLEAIAQQVSEAVFAINRLPGSIMSILFQLYGITQSVGTKPTTTVQFNLSDTLGHTIPAGVRLMLLLDGGLLPIVFTTDVDLVIASGSSSGTVTATGDRYTSEGNGVVSGTALSTLDGLIYVNSVALAADVAGGTDPETTAEWQQRAVQALGRLSSTLVTAPQFLSAALEYNYVYRAKVLDNYKPSLNLMLYLDSVFDYYDTSGGHATATNWTSIIGGNCDVDISSTVSDNGITGKTLRITSSGNGDAVFDNTVNNVTPVIPGDTYTVFASIRAAATSRAWEIDIVWEKANSITAGIETISILSGSETTSGWYRLAATATAPADAVAFTYKVTIKSTVASEVHYLDRVGVAHGSDVPWDIGYHPPGDDAGYVAVVVYGDGAELTTDQKSTIASDFANQAEANLSISVIDPEINTVDVNVTVKKTDSAVSSDVQAAVTTALQNYLTPNSWGWGAVVYLNELIALVSNVTGVDRVVSFTTPSADVSFNNTNAVLVQYGTITVTVS